MVFRKRRNSWKVDGIITTKFQMDLYFRLIIQVLIIGWLIGGKNIFFLKLKSQLILDRISSDILFIDPRPTHQNHSFSCVKQLKAKQLKVL